MNPESKEQEASNLLQKAYNKFAAEKYDTALKYCQDALAIYQEIGDIVGIGHTQANIANVHRKLAQEFYQQALSTFRDNNNQEEAAKIEQSLLSNLDFEPVWYVSYNQQVEILRTTESTNIYRGDGEPGGENPSFHINGDGETGSDSDGQPGNGGG